MTMAQGGKPVVVADSVSNCELFTTSTLQNKESTIQVQNGQNCSF